MASTPITSTVIAIDRRRGALHYYSMLGNDRASIVHRVKNYAGEAFTDDFYIKFKDAVAGFVEDQPSETVRKISVIIPDDAVALDTIRLPLLRSSRYLQNALNVKLNDIYKNRDELKILDYLSEKNKQYCAFSTAAVRKEIITSLAAACADNKLTVDALTYSSASVAAATSALNPKMKNESYLFLDIKDIYSRFIFVAGGKTVGFFTLPFGLEFLGEPRYIQEDMLFEHSLAEITVLNAREKAKAKKLTLMRELDITDDTVSEPAPEDVGADSSLEDADYGEVEQESVSLESPIAMPTDSSASPDRAKVKVLAKKTPRKLPAFMLRPIPETEEGIVEEKFRTFMKWGLSILRANPALTSIGMPKMLYVNLPSKYQYVIDNISVEEKENGIPTERFNLADDDADLAFHLELFGGLNTKLWHPGMKF